MKKITAQYLRDSMPEWKKKKDPMLVRYITRPLSFYIAAVLANQGISANSVSYFSTLVAISGAFCYLFNNHVLNILGATLIFVWLVLDCVDGNLARSVKRQPFGEFADGISSYILIGIMVTCIGYAAYNEGGVFIHAGSAWIIVVGAFASVSDTMMRLIYQKYRATEREMADKNILPIENDVFQDHSQVDNWKVKVNMELGIPSVLTVLIIVSSIFCWLDIVVFYCFAYYGSACGVSSIMYIRKAIELANKYQNNMPQPDLSALEE